MWNNIQTTKKNTASIQTQVNAKQALITANTKSVADLTQQNRATQAQIAPLLASAQIFPDEMSSLATARGLVESQMAQIYTLLPATVNLTSVAYTGVTDTISGSSVSEQNILSYAAALRDTGGFNVVVNSITYAPTTDAAGDITPLYNFSLQIN